MRVWKMTSMVRLGSSDDQGQLEEHKSVPLEPVSHPSRREVRDA